MILEEVHQEIRRLVYSLSKDREKQGSFDLEAAEFFIRDRMHRCGAIILEHILEHEDGRTVEVCCPCGGTFRNQKNREKTILTVLGYVRLRRIIQCCDECGAWRAVQDKVLDVQRTGFSPGVRRMMARTAAEVCFDKARDFMCDLAGVMVSDKDVERISEGIGADIGEKNQVKVQAVMKGEPVASTDCPKILYIVTDGTGVPVLKKETEGRKAKAADQIARTREAKLGAVFTQTKTNKEGEPIRDPASTSYVGRIESVETFGPRLYTEALRRGLNEAELVVVLGDGALWIWNLADEHFPGATQIVDFYHAKEHLWEMARTFFSDNEQERNEWAKAICDDLWEGQIASVLDTLSSLSGRGKIMELIDKKIIYFENNKERMCYNYYRQAGLFIGSGVVEAGCKTVIAQRLKHSGMRWTVRGANSIISLRCCIASGYFEDYWEDRLVA